MGNTASCQSEVELSRTSKQLEASVQAKLPAVRQKYQDYMEPKTRSAWQLVLASIPEQYDLRQAEGHHYTAKTPANSHAEAHKAILQLKEAWQTDHGCFQQFAQSLSDSVDPTEMQELLKQHCDCLQVASKFLHRCSLKFLHMLMNATYSPGDKLQDHAHEVTALANELGISKAVRQEFREACEDLQKIAVHFNRTWNVKPKYMQLMQGKMATDRERWFCFDQVGSGKTKAAILASELVESPLTLVIAPKAIHSGWSLATESVDKDARILNGKDKSTLAWYTAEMAICKRYDTDSDYIAEHGRTYILIVGQAVHDENFEILKATIKHDLVGPASLAKLIIIDESHGYLGNGKHNWVMRDLLNTSAVKVKVMSISGSPIGKRGLKDGEKAQALLDLPAEHEPDIDWQTAWARLKHHGMAGQNEAIEKELWDTARLFRFMLQHSQTVSEPVPLAIAKRLSLPLQQPIPGKPGVVQYEDEVKETKLAGLLLQLQEPEFQDTPAVLYMGVVSSPGRSLDNPQNVRNGLRDWVQRGLENSKVANLGPGSVRVLDITDFDDRENARSVLRSGNPKDSQFANVEDWHHRGTRVIIMTPALSIGVDGVQNLTKNLGLWTPPSSSTRQVYGRLDRPTDSGTDEALQVWALCVVQPGGYSREKAALQRGELAIRLADAAGDGMCDVELEKNTPVQDLSQLGIASQAAQSFTHLQLPVWEPKGRKRRKLHDYCRPPKRRRCQVEEEEDTDLLGIFLPDPEPEVDPRRTSRKPFNKQLGQEQLSAARQYLMANPEAVLRSMLTCLTECPTRHSYMPPYMLMMLTRIQQLRRTASGTQPPRYSIAALDIEAFTMEREVARWPKYAQLAATGETPVMVLEFGCATINTKLAVDVKTTMDRQHEATTGYVDGVKSEVFRDDGKSQNVNQGTWDKTQSSARVSKPQVATTPYAALKKCLSALEQMLPQGGVVFTHSTGAFDESAVSKILLMAKAGLQHGDDGCPKARMWDAAQQWDEDDVPAFFQGHGPFRLLHNVLWQELEELDHHDASDLVQRAHDADQAYLPCKLEDAYQVVLGIKLKAEHCADDDSKMTATAHHTLPECFQSDACFEMLKSIEAWLREQTESLEQQLRTQIRWLCANQAMGKVVQGMQSSGDAAASGPLIRTRDPAHIPQLVSQRKGITQILRYTRG